MKKTIRLLFIALCLYPILGFQPLALADITPRVIQLNPNFGKPLRLPENAATIAIGDPNIADIVTVEPDLLMITGQRNGSTSMTVIGKSGDIYQYTLLVSNDVTQLKTLIRSVGPNVIVESIQGRILLKGTVETPAQLTRVLTIADRYMGGKGSTPRFRVISDQGGVLAGNLPETQQQKVVPLSVPTGGGGGGLNGSRRRNGNNNSNGLNSTGKANLAQNISRASVLSVANGKVISMIKVINLPKVEIQMRIVEVDRNKTDEFGIDWRLDGRDVSIASKAGDVVPVLPNPIAGAGNLASGTADLLGLIRNSSRTIGLAAFVRAMEEKGATTTLSEPLLTALSGEATQFMVGGSVPIPFQTQSSSNNTVATATNVRFMSFGLAISVRPTVLENGKINILLDQTMSSLDYANAIQIIGAPVPGFNQKTVSTVTESESGETWAVAGLLTEEDRKRLQSVPWVSKIPILGKVFENKNDAVQRNELIILVTARRVDKPNSTTTNFNGRGWLDPSMNKPHVEEKIIGKELDSSLPAEQSKKIKKETPIEKNIRSIEIHREPPITNKRSPQQYNDSIKKSSNQFHYKPLLRSKIARVSYRKLNPHIENKTKISIIHLNRKKNTLLTEARQPNHSAQFYTFNQEKQHRLHKGLHSDTAHNKYTHIKNTSEYRIPIYDYDNFKTPSRKKVATIKVASTNARSEIVTGYHKRNKPIDNNKYRINNFLVGNEKLSYLNMIISQNPKLKSTKNIKTWKIASASSELNPNKEIIFAIKPGLGLNSRILSGSGFHIKKTIHQHLSAADS